MDLRLGVLYSVFSDSHQAIRSDSRSTRNLGARARAEGFRVTPSRTFGVSDNLEPKISNDKGLSLKINSFLDPKF